MSVTCVKRDAEIEWLELLGYDIERHRKVVSSRLGFAPYSRLVRGAVVEW